MKLYIKNMVCGRCEMVVTSELEKMGLSILSIQLGEVEIATDLDNSQKQMLSKNLISIGFELLDDKENKTVERIKNRVIDLVYYKTEQLKINLSSYLAEDLGQDYSMLSKLFSEKEGATIAHYFIAQKIERAKALLLYNEMTLSEIAIQLSYSSVAHLSSQFKKITGYTPTQFKQLKDNTRKQIDGL
jgi:AraC-like DNA-binding protein